MEVGVRNGDVVTGVGDVQKAVIVVLVYAEVTANIEVIEPNVAGLLDSKAIAALDLAKLQVADDDVVGLLDSNADTGDGYDGGLSARLWPGVAALRGTILQAPAFPRRLVLAPTFTEPVPVMLPETKTIFLASPLTAAVRAARLETVVVVPPAPPVVLSEPVLVDMRQRHGGDGGNGIKTHPPLVEA
jgi:hypothetical protein